MSKEPYTKCHYIPQVYLRQWRYDKKTEKEYAEVQVFDKVNQKKLYKKIEDNYYVDDLYNPYLKESLDLYCNLPQNMKESFISKIDDYTKNNNIEIYYGQENLKYKENLNILYLNNQEKIKFKKNDKFVSDTANKEIYNKLMSIKCTNIEQDFNKKIETFWNDFIQKLDKGKTEFEKDSSHNIVSLSTKQLNYLHDFIITMITRIKNIPGIQGYDLEIKNISKFVDNSVIKSMFEGIEKASTPCNKFPDYHFITQNYDLLNKKNNHFKESFFYNENRNCQMLIIRDNNDLEFYTSDVPCFLEEESNTIYCPATDKIFLMFTKEDTQNSNIKIVEASADDVLRLNDLVCEHAKNDIIFKNKWRSTNV